MKPSLPKVTHRLLSSWDVLNEIREEIRQNFADFDDELIMDIQFAASELCENAIKYGKEILKHENAIQAHVSGDFVRVLVTNGVCTAADLDAVKEHIDKLNSGANPMDLYIERLQELMNNPKPGESRLGLFRIVNEAGFSLRYDIEGEFLTVTAEKHI